jgi:hypothetical protein
LHRLAIETLQPIDAELAERLATRDMLGEFGFEEIAGSGGRFRQRRIWRATARTAALIDEAIARSWDDLNTYVETLFPPA